MEKYSLTALAGFVAVCFLAAMTGALAHASEPSGESYGALERRTVQLTRDHDLGCSD